LTRNVTNLLVLTIRENTIHNIFQNHKIYSKIYVYVEQEFFSWYTIKHLSTNAHGQNLPLFDIEEFLPRDATQSAVMPQQVVCLSFCPSATL